MKRKRRIVNLLAALALVISLVVAALPAGIGAAPPPPVANAGPDQLVMPTNPGAAAPALIYNPVQLDASASYDLTPSEALNFSWTLVSGPNTPTLLPNSTDESPTFTPQHGVYVWDLAVTAGGATTSDTVIVVAGGAAWYVDIGGLNTNPGTAPGPGGAWREIDFAVSNPDVVHGDIIIVGPSSPSRYGGPGAEENIVVDKSLTIVSSGGYTVTTIDVSGQTTVPVSYTHLRAHET